MAKILSISKAKQKLLELARMNEELGESFILLKDSNPVSVLLPFDEYESIMETLDILEQDPQILSRLKKAEKEIASGKYTIWKAPDKKQKAA
ncbi:MAG: type II toxin-antitoxin system Phd/YefM family antitoxin [Oligoflexia bacterium]|nr:type II toxin-antitoxin system Phd/YefM family antitoxin [Oligoflexia bacterium]